MKKTKSSNKLLQQFENDKIESLEKVKKTVGGARRNHSESESSNNLTQHPTPKIQFP